MGRPRKPPGSRMDDQLRIPLTPGQKRLIARAISEEPNGMATWARQVLLRAAKEQLSARSHGDSDANM